MKSASKLATVVIAISLGAAVLARPFAEEDPLLALPSDSYRPHDEHQLVNYVTHVDHIVSQEAAPVHLGAEASLDNQHDPNCAKSQEYRPLAEPNSPPSSSREYPGQIIYLNSNNEVVGTSPPGDAPTKSQELSAVADAVSHVSGMAATILTEVPVKDMPQEVLERLRREYGVKVVATRDGPGANLVINCDEYSDQESSICAKQADEQQPPHQVYSTYAYPSPTGDDSSANYAVTENAEVSYEPAEPTQGDSPAQLTQTYNAQRQAAPVEIQADGVESQPEQSEGSSDDQATGHAAVEATQPSADYQEASGQEQGSKVVEEVYETSSQQ